MKFSRNQMIGSIILLGAILLAALFRFLIFQNK